MLLIFKDAAIFKIKIIELIAINKKHIYSFIISIFLLNGLQATPPVKNFVRTKEGLIVYPDVRFSGNTRAVRLQVISNNIIRVTASPDLLFSDAKSLITVYNTTSQNYSVTKKADKIILRTPSITASILLSNGAISFADKNELPILMERQNNGRSFIPAVFEGQNSYGIRQTFQSTTDDAYYGLGQHQDDQFNYKGQQVFMFQNNTEVAIPFLVSKKNYGILWDNYSITKVGDTRNYLPLSALKLYSKDGTYGFLTASYSNDRFKPADVAFTKAASDINYAYLNDYKNDLPLSFRSQNGMITWEGSIASGFSGMHNFKFTYAGYAKVWIDGKLMFDKWRQAWNPGTAVLKLNLNKNEKHLIKIQWSPDGRESYFSVKWINPVATEDENAYTFSSEAEKQLDYYFIKGDNIDEVIFGYRSITGKATIVPKWAMGFWQSRERYKTQDEVLNTANEFRKRKIPLDNIVLDWNYWKENEWGSQDFDASRFANPDSMISVLHNKYKVHFMISAWPKFYEGIPAYNEFNKRGWLYKRNVADSQRDWIAQGYVSTFYDAFNDDAKKGFWDLLNKKLYSKGVDAWWMDASEPDILSNVSPEKRKELMTPTAAGLTAEYVNAYPLENAKGIYNGQRSVDPNKRVFLLTRSGFAGSQHYAASIWSGDIASRWEDMRTQISAGLNFSMSGLPFWTMDIGGFAVEHRYENPNPQDLEEWRELQTRWYQFGSFVPLFRVHGQYPYREIFNIASEDHPAYKSMLYYDKLRYRLMPYIYTLAGMAYHNDYTIMRGLVMDFPKDNNVKNIGDQFMFGPSLLINPIYKYKEMNKEVYLPSGQGWYDLYTGKFLEGGQAMSIHTDYERIPVFVKEGAIIPSGKELQYTSEKINDTLTLNIYTGKNASFTLYEDEETNYNYEKGSFSNIPINYNESINQLTIGERKGSYNGMIRKRIFKIIWVDKKHYKGLDFNAYPDDVVNYDGRSVSIKHNITR